MLKKILIGLGAVIVVFVAVGFILPGNITIERSKVIDVPAPWLYDQIATPKKWNNWSPWHEIDPQGTKYTYGDIEMGKGAWYSWESANPNVGKGKMEFTEAIENQSLTATLSFEGTEPSVTYYKMEPAEGKTKLVWGMNADMGMNPIARWFGLFFDGMLGPDFEKGINNLEAFYQKSKAEAPQYEVLEQDLQPMEYLYITVSCASNKIGEELGKAYGLLSAEIAKQKLEFAGPVFAIYDEWSPEKTVMRPAIPVKKAGKPSGEIKVGSMAATKALVVNYYGGYEGGMEAHMAVDNHAKNKGIILKNPPLEIYVTDPMAEPDTAKWLTIVAYPL